MLTGLTTVLSLVALLLFGGAVIHDFAFTLLVGIVWEPIPRSSWPPLSSWSGRTAGARRPAAEPAPRATGGPPVDAARTSHFAPRDGAARVPSRSSVAGCWYCDGHERTSLQDRYAPEHLFRLRAANTQAFASELRRGDEVAPMVAAPHHQAFEGS